MTSAVMSSFDLNRLMTIVFHPRPGENVAVFIDLENLDDIRDLRFLNDPKLTTQRIGYEIFYLGLKDVKKELPFTGVDFFAYEPTGGSNLDLPETVVDLDGHQLRLAEDVLGRLDIVLYLSTYSATAPITPLAKKMGFRGATMHGCNEKILETGLSRNYDEVSAKAERFRQALTRCDDVVIEFETLGRKYRLALDLGKQEAQKSHGLRRTPGEIANLPAGEIYWVPADASGQFPMKFKEDGTIALMDVAGCRVRNATLLKGNARTVEAALAKYRSDPATGELGELGLGTQDLPFAGADIQDEKILG